MLSNQPEPNSLLSQPLWWLLSEQFINQTAIADLIKFTPFEIKRIRQRCIEITDSSGLEVLALSVQIRPLHDWVASDTPLSNKFRVYLAYLGIET